MRHAIAAAISAAFLLLGFNHAFAQEKECMTHDQAIAQASHADGNVKVAAITGQEAATVQAGLVAKFGIEPVKEVSFITLNFEGLPFLYVLRFSGQCLADSGRIPHDKLSALMRGEPI